jgi:hypothetical protein
MSIPFLIALMKRNLYCVVERRQLAELSPVARYTIKALKIETIIELGEDTHI